MAVEVGWQWRRWGDGNNIREMAVDRSLGPLWRLISVGREAADCGGTGASKGQKWHEEMANGHVDKIRSINVDIDVLIDVCWRTF